MPGEGSPLTPERRWTVGSLFGLPADAVPAGRRAGQDSSVERPIDERQMGLSETASRDSFRPIRKNIGTASTIGSPSSHRSPIHQDANAVTLIGLSVSLRTRLSNAR